MQWKLMWISRAKPYLAVALAGMSESGNGRHVNYFSLALNSDVCAKIVPVATGVVGM